MATRYQFVDDSGETRLAGFLEPDPGGSSAVLRGALVYGVAAPVDISSDVAITFAHVNYDTDGFWNAASGGFVIPAGLAGAYLLTASGTYSGATTLTLMRAKIDYTDELVMSQWPTLEVPVSGSTIRDLTISGAGQWAVGGVIKFFAGAAGTGALTFEADNSMFGLTYLGPVT